MGRPVQRVPVNTGHAPYGVSIGDGALQLLGASVREGAPGTTRAFLVFDEGVPSDVVSGAEASLVRAGFVVGRFGMRPTEETKSLQTLDAMCAAMAEGGHERGAPVVALGGGIVGDVAGFGASAFARGCPVLQCPTTLLAMVDASVGGKTGVNLDTSRGLLKNMVGAFHQPIGVIADVGVLASLPDRDLRAGLGECVKHAMLSGLTGDDDLAPWTHDSLGAILDREPGALVELVTRNVRVKAAIVEADETETGRGPVSRHMLNLGHTFAHAYESVRTLSPSDHPTDAPLRHGEAVALGLVSAAGASVHLGLAPASLLDAVRERVGACGLPVRVRDLPNADRLIELMGSDKKVRDARIPLVLPLEGARATLVRDPGRDAIEAGFAALRA